MFNNLKKLIYLSLIINFTILGEQLLKTVTPGLYEHYSGKKYEVIGTARYSENPAQEFVIYKQLYESEIRGTTTKLPIGTIWARPIESFIQIIEINDQKVARFKKIN